MEIVLMIVVMALALQLLFVLQNMYFFPKMGGLKADEDITTSISILIPARNEEGNIRACVESIMAQTVQPIEVLILDDHSTDNTASILESLQQQYPRLSYWQGASLPEDWKGKVFACHQLSEQAQGDWLLYLDADVRLDQEAIAALEPHLAKQKRGMISGFPKQIVKTQLERLLVTMMQFVILCHLPVRQIKQSSDARFAAAHGGFVAINRKTYDQIGGHEAIKDAMVDDMALMKRVKDAEAPAQLLKIDDYVWMRMYHDASDVWQGYMKNIFTGLNRNYLLMFALICLYTMLYLIPVVTLWISGLHLLSLISLVLAAITKGLIDVWSGVKPWHGLLISVSAALLIMLLVQSAWKSVRKHGYVWKGRRYL
ncbi:glycosyltransferase [Alkalibacillus almallahensis]|uniref:glycosyltransferase n=1 Tax=Alkalibacillus almallahensis TaxID=1379154 RepID=UPI00141D8437|nr:glycosyltransferase family 2 protein [Alkalibacillus almallahensis]NIK11395.1 glycosyltransferase involved in cell wall biosynthesis [Alkalibacillus almallahensis]